MVISEQEKRLRGERGREREEKRKVFAVDREITGFIMLSWLILSISSDGVAAGTGETLVFER